MLCKYNNTRVYTAQKMEFSIKDFFSKCDQLRRKLQIWSQLLKKSLMENFIFCVVLAGVYAAVTRPEVYSEPCQTPKMQHFAIIVNG